MLNIELVGCIHSQKNWRDLLVDGNCVYMWFPFLAFVHFIYQKPDETVKKLNDHGQKNVILGIRGEDIKFDPQNLDLYKDNTFSAVIEDTEIMENENNLYFQFAGSKTVARVSKYEISQMGDKVSFVFMPHKLHFFGSTTEKTI